MEEKTVPIRVSKNALKVLRQMKQEIKKSGGFASYSKIIENLGGTQDKSYIPHSREELELIRKMLTAIRKTKRNQKLKRNLIDQFLDMPAIRD